MKLVLALTLALFVNRFALSTSICEAESSDSLFENFSDSRNQLSEIGVEIESILTAEIVKNTSGGVKTSTSDLYNYDLGKIGHPIKSTRILRISTCSI